jgi:hypothetical protein
MTDHHHPHEDDFLITCRDCGWMRMTGRTEYGQLTIRECPWCGSVGWLEMGFRACRGDGLRRASFPYEHAGRRVELVA